MILWKGERAGAFYYCVIIGADTKQRGASKMGWAGPDLLIVYNAELKIIAYKKFKVLMWFKNVHKIFELIYSSFNKRMLPTSDVLL